MGGAAEVVGATGSRASALGAGGATGWAGEVTC